MQADAIASAVTRSLNRRGKIEKVCRCEEALSSVVLLRSHEDV